MQSTKVAVFVTMLALCVACSNSSQARPGTTVPLSSMAVTSAAIPEATSTPITKCDDAITEALVRRFVEEFNAGAIDKVDLCSSPVALVFDFCPRWRGDQLRRERTIKFQIHCKTQLIAAIAWDGVDQPALRR